jgi:hypothetical protein
MKERSRSYAIWIFSFDASLESVAAERGWRAHCHLGNRDHSGRFADIAGKDAILRCELLTIDCSGRSGGVIPRATPLLGNGAYVFGIAGCSFSANLRRVPK